MERQCAVIRLRAERRMGELLAKTVQPGNFKLSPRVTIRLSELGITRNQSAKWQTAATLPAVEFERYVAISREPTTAGVLKLVQERERQQPGPRSGGHILTGPASGLWDRLTRFGGPLLDRPALFGSRPLPRVGGTGGEQTETRRAVPRLLRSEVLAASFGGDESALELLWTFAIHFDGPHRPIHPRHVQNTWQPVVAFSRERATAGWIVDLLESGGREKGLPRPPEDPQRC